MFSIFNKNTDCKDLNLTTIYPFLYSSISLDRLAELDYTNNINCYFYENNLNKVNFEIDYKNIEKIISSDLDVCIETFSKEELSFFKLDDLNDLKNKILYTYQNKE